MAEARRVAAHLIDLRDHLHIHGDRDVAGDWLEALRWPEPLYRLMSSRRSTSINRLRASEWRRLFDRAGLRVAYWNVERLPLPPGFDRSRLRPRWRDLDPEDLTTASVDVGLVRCPRAGRLSGVSRLTPQA